jgi:tRNA dimethylallyltransferase
VKSKNPIVVIAGPTASGKSQIAISLAKKINGYIINADSRQVYKELKIGTAQPKPERIDNDIWYIENVRHLLYGYRSLTNPLNISVYQNDVQDVFNTQEGVSILVGGTGLYIDCIVYNYDLKNEDIDVKLREKLSKLSTEKLQALINPNILKDMNNSDRGNPRRLIRVIEREQMGKKDINRKENEPLEHIYFAVNIPREELKKRIAKRIDLMFEQGLEKEVKELFNRYDSNLPSFNTIGYQEFREYFNGKKTLKEVQEEILTHTYQYAKRQKTWFKKNRSTIWTEDINTIVQEAEQFITIS